MRRRLEGDALTRAIAREASRNLPSHHVWFDDAADKPVLVGIAPSPTGRPGEPAIAPRIGEPVRSPTARALQEALGCPVPHVFATTNLLERAGDERDLTLVRERGRQLLRILRGRRIVALGRVVTIALVGRSLPWFEPHSVERAGQTTVVVIPHPSGLNRWWNERKNRKHAALFLRTLASVTGPMHTAGLR